MLSCITSRSDTLAKFKQSRTTQLEVAMYLLSHHLGPNLIKVIVIGLINIASTVANA